jgi:23S rRNA pseudouridine2605 synthase
MKNDSNNRGKDKRHSSSKRAVGKGPKTPAGKKPAAGGFTRKPASRDDFARRDDGSSRDGFENSRRTYASKPDAEEKPKAKGPRAKATFGPKNPSTGTRMYGRPTEFTENEGARSSEGTRGGKREDRNAGPTARKFAPRGEERPRREGADRSTSSRPFTNDKSKSKSFDGNKGDAPKKPYNKDDKRGGDRKEGFNKPFVKGERGSEKKDLEPKKLYVKDDFDDDDFIPYVKDLFDDEAKPAAPKSKPDAAPKKVYVRTGRGVAKADEGKAPEYDFKHIKDIEKNQNRFRKTKIESSTGGEIRLNRYISNAGICSRRDADLLIEQGEIFVNGTAVTELGYKVAPGDVVKYGKRTLSREKMVYLLLNKPKDFITTTKDPEERKTVMQLVSNACKERVYPVGRLDRNTTGLLLLTNDGEMAEKLSHPSNKMKKIYEVTLDKPIDKEHFNKIVAGVTLEDGFVKVDELAIVNGSTVLGVEIHSGKNRIVRRIFESFGYEVIKLDRVLYAGLDKKDLPRGHWRFLTEKEVIQLKYFK